MRRLGPVDAALLATLLPVWVVAFALHVREVVRSDLAQPTFFVSLPDPADAYPRVRGFRPEQGGDTAGLRVGDRLIQLGDVDLRGAGHIGVDAVAIAEAGPDLRAPLVYERGGRRVETEVRLAPAPVPWMRVPVLLGMALVAVVVLLRAPPSAHPRLVYVAFMLVLISQTPFHGGSVVQTYASKLIFYALVIVAPSLILYWAVRFSDESVPPGRVALWLPWLFVPLNAFVRANYFLDGPLPGDIAPRAGPVSDGLAVASTLLAVTYNYLRAGPLHRRRVKWLLFGGYVGFAPLVVVTAVLPAFEPGVAWYSQAVGLAVPLTVAFPLGLLVAIVRQHLFDIDRIISAAATYTALGVVVLAGALTVIPRIAEITSRTMGFEPATGQLVLTALLALVVVPAHRRIRPQVDRLFFPERFSLELGIQGLLAEISAYGRPHELVLRVAARLEALLRPSSLVVYVRYREDFVPVCARGRDDAPDVEGDSPLVAALRRRPLPLAASASGPRSSRRLDPFERAVLEELGVAVVAPVRARGDLDAFLCFGPKRSGDIYTHTELTWLATIVDRIRVQLERLDDAALLREGRELREALRSYVPGSVAARLESGRSLEGAERPVTVLFVDIRGYTTYSQGREPAEIFSLVNRYTEAVSRIVAENNGTVVEFLGDGLMAVFGAPEEIPRKERAAVVAAEEIVHAMRSLSGDDPPLRVGVGLATGPAFVGSIRSADRLIWSALGNTTSLASRLQSLSRDLEASIVMDAPTHASAGAFAADFVRRPGLPIRGFSEPHDVYLKPLEP